MGSVSRMLVPRGVRRAAHPVRTAKRAVTPKTVKQMQRAVHPLDNAAYDVQRSLNTKPRKPGAARFCKTCGGRLPRGAPGGQRYCGPACRPGVTGRRVVAQAERSPLRAPEQATETMHPVTVFILMVMFVAVCVWLLTITTVWITIGAVCGVFIAVVKIRNGARD